MRSRIINYLVIFGGLLLLINLIRSTASISDKSKIIEDANRRLIEAEDKNSRLKRDLAQIESPEYIEKEARNKLNLGKEGEYVVILPPISPQPSPTPIEAVANWERWLGVFR